MAEVENLFLGHLRHIRGPLDQIENDIRVIKSDPVSRKFMSQSNRSRLDARLSRIEKRAILSKANHLSSNHQVKGKACH